MKILKITAIVLVVLIAGVSLTIWFVSDPLPEGKSGREAEALADKMLMAINKPAYDSLQELRWSFPRGHHFVWDKRSNAVEVKWDDYVVQLDPDNQSGTASKSSITLAGEDLDKAVSKAWKLFANDSFWLVAPYKIRDPGTERRMVETDDGPALLVTYTSGGVTPGDSYLWLLDSDGRPKAWKMWVSILPWKGLEFTWEDWQQHRGAWLAPTHRGPGPATVNLLNLQVR